MKKISSWKGKLTALAEVKKKEDKTLDKTISRHPSGNNISSQPQPLHNSTCAYDGSSQSSIDSQKFEGVDGNLEAPANTPKISFDGLDDSTPERTPKSSTEEVKMTNRLDDSCIDIVNISHDALDKHKTQEVSSAIAPPAAVVQPSHTQHFSVPINKWHTREHSNPLDFQLISPFPSTLHADLYLKPGVLVDESQPSSIIAYTLASSKFIVKANPFLYQSE